jgi:hypothetical protein
MYFYIYWREWRLLNLKCLYLSNEVDVFLLWRGERCLLRELCSLFMLLFTLDSRSNHITGWYSLYGITGTYFFTHFSSTIYFSVFSHFLTFMNTFSFRIFFFRDFRILYSSSSLFQLRILRKNLITLQS